MCQPVTFIFTTQLPNLEKYNIDVLCLIIPGNLPTYAKKYHPGVGKLVIVNLQPTKHDKKADLCIKTYVDRVFELLFERLGLSIPEYDPASDPTRQVRSLPPKTKFVEWTQSGEAAKQMKAEADQLDTDFKARKKLERLKKREPTEVEEADEVKKPKVEKELSNDVNADAKPTEATEVDEVNKTKVDLYGTGGEHKELKEEAVKNDDKEDVEVKEEAEVKEEEEVQEAGEASG